MEILFLSSGYKTIHHRLIQGINECLENNKLKVSTEFDSSVKYDCILVFNRKTLEQYKTTLKSVKTPIVYLFCLSDMATEYIVSEIPGQTIIFKDKVFNLQHLSQVPLTYQYLVLPTKFCRNPNQIHPNEKPILFIRIDDAYFGNSILLKILPLLNRLHDYEIHYQSAKGVGTYLVNKHIKFVVHQQNTEEWLDKSDLVIGSGLVAYEAILRAKKTIVVGEKGYGGLVTETNLEYHLSNFFQGRNGGKFDEYIPLQLLWNAIMVEAPDTQKIMKKLSALQALNEKKLISLIEQMSFSVKDGVDKAAFNYMLNPKYEITKKKSRRWLSEQAFNKLYKPVNESESAIILTFRKPHTIEKALALFPAEYAGIIKEYIHELILNKVLIPVPNQIAKIEIR